jgi:hypothetical protein
MENLIKPVDYAKKMGISRQAVYAKIKKGLLPSRNVDGKIYIVLEEEPAPSEAPAPAEAPLTENTRELLAAKEETIAVLKETIRDLKETNRMITSTLRSEVELLKEAFGEMKTLYAARLERLEPEAITLAEYSEEVSLGEEPEGGEERDTPSAEPEADETPEWLELGRFLEEQGIDKKKQRKRFYERVAKLAKKGTKGVKEEGGRYWLSPRRAAKLMEKLLDGGR